MPCKFWPSILCSLSKCRSSWYPLECLSILCVLTCSWFVIPLISLHRCCVFIFSSGIIFLCLSQRSHDAGEFSGPIFPFSKVYLLNPSFCI